MTSLTQLFSKRDAHPIVIDVALIATFGPEWMTWDGDSTIIAVGRQFSPPSKQTQQKIYALGVLHANHAYWQDWRAFEGCSWALGGQQADLGQVTPLTAYPLVYGYRTSKWIDPETVLSDEVQAYILSVFIHEQFSQLPLDLSFLQPRLLTMRPDLRERSEQVRAMLVSGAQGAGLEDESTDAIAVEVTRHRVLDSMLRAVCSPASILEQAKLFELEQMVEPLFKVGN